VTTSAGASPVKSSARIGDARGSSQSDRSGRYCDRKYSMSARVRKNPSAIERTESVSSLRSSAGYTRPWTTGAGTSSSSRVSWATTAARLPPALSPMTPTRPGAVPSSSQAWWTQA